MTIPKIVNVSKPDMIGYMLDVMSPLCQNAERDACHDALRATSSLFTDMLLAVGQLEQILGGYRDAFYASNLGLDGGTPLDRGLDVAYHHVAGQPRDGDAGAWDQDAPFMMVDRALRTLECVIVAATGKVVDTANRIRPDLPADEIDEIHDRIRTAAWKNNRHIDQDDE